MQNRPKLLLVEDDEDLAAAITTLVSDTYQLRVANNVRAAIEALLESRPDLILLDAGLGDDCCVPVAEEVRRLFPDFTPRMMLFTGLSTPWALCQRLGINEAIIKPNVITEEGHFIVWQRVGTGAGVKTVLRAEDVAPLPISLPLRTRS